MEELIELLGLPEEEIEDLLIDCNMDLEDLVGGE